MSAASTGPTAPERELLDAARAGDEDAYRRLVEPYRCELHAHCYRMLGSVHDAEDALQEALLRAWRGLARFEGRSSVRSWLYRIATNTCLDAIARRPKRVLPIDYGPGRRPPRRPRRAAGRVGLGRALPGRAAGRRGRLRRARGPLRAARGRGARLRRGAPAPAGQPARGADPARGARLLGPRGRRGARDDHRLGQQRAAARPQDGRRAAARPEPAGHAARARRRGAARDRRQLRGRVGAGDVDTVVADAGRGRGVLDAAAGELVPRPRGDQGLPRRLAALRRLALARRSHSGQRAAGARLLHVGRGRGGLSRRSRSTCSRFAARGSRRSTPSSRAPTWIPIPGSWRGCRSSLPIRRRSRPSSSASACPPGWTSSAAGRARQRSPAARRAK